MGSLRQDKQQSDLKMSLLASSLLLTLASSAEIFHRIPHSRIPNSCSTLSGSSCVFPFSYGGVTHYQCTYTDSPVPWCATATNTDGSVVTNSWGDCTISSSSSWSSESLTITPCTTTAGAACQFPFTFNGVTHSSCADWIYGGQPAGTTWCSTQVDSAGVHVNGQGSYGFCPSSCPGVQPQSINLLTKRKNSAVRFGGGRGPQ